MASRALRDQPREILRRIMVISTVCVVWPSALYFCFYDAEREGTGPTFWAWLGLEVGVKAYFSLVSCLMTIITLFLGPLLTFAYSAELEPSTPFDMKSVRGYIAAPIFEELIFRSCLITVLLAAGFGGLTAVCVAAVVFGLSHLHLMLEVPSDQRKALLHVYVFQCCFTGLFGLIAGMMFWQTGSLYGPVAVHSFCNLMSVPDLSFLSPYHSAYRYRTRLVLGYLLGIAGFFALFYYLLDPALYQSWHFALAS